MFYDKSSYHHILKVFHNTKKKKLINIFNVKQQNKLMFPAMDSTCQSQSGF